MPKPSASSKSSARSRGVRRAPTSALAASSLAAVLDSEQRDWHAFAKQIASSARAQMDEFIAHMTAQHRLIRLLHARVVHLEATHDSLHCSTCADQVSEQTQHVKALKRTGSGSHLPNPVTPLGAARRTAGIVSPAAASGTADVDMDEDDLSVVQPQEDKGASSSSAKPHKPMTRASRQNLSVSGDVTMKLMYRALGMTDTGGTRDTFTSPVGGTSKAASSSSPTALSSLVGPQVTPRRTRSGRLLSPRPSHTLTHTEDEYAEKRHSEEQEERKRTDNEDEDERDWEDEKDNADSGSRRKRKWPRATATQLPAEDDFGASSGGGSGDEHNDDKPHDHHSKRRKASQTGGSDSGRSGRRSTRKRPKRASSSLQRQKTEQVNYEDDVHTSKRRAGASGSSSFMEVDTQPVVEDAPGPTRRVTRSQSMSRSRRSRSPRDHKAADSGSDDDDDGVDATVVTSSSSRRRQPTVTPGPSSSGFKGDERGVTPDVNEEMLRMMYDAEKMSEPQSSRRRGSRRSGSVSPSPAAGSSTGRKRRVRTRSSAAHTRQHSDRSDARTPVTPPTTPADRSGRATGSREPSAASGDQQGRRAAKPLQVFEPSAEDLAESKKQLKLARKWLGKRRYGAALECCNNGIRLAGDRADALLYYMRCDAFYNLGQYDEALTSANTFLALKGDDPRGYASRAILYTKQHKFEDALRNMQTAMSLAKNRTAKRKYEARMEKIRHSQAVYLSKHGAQTPSKSSNPPRASDAPSSHTNSTEHKTMQAAPADDQHDSSGPPTQPPPARASPLSPDRLHRTRSGRLLVASQQVRAGPMAAASPVPSPTRSRLRRLLSGGSSTSVGALPTTDSTAYPGGASNTKAASSSSSSKRNANAIASQHSQESTSTSRSSKSSKSKYPYLTNEGIEDLLGVSGFQRALLLLDKKGVVKSLKPCKVDGLHAIRGEVRHSLKGPRTVEVLVKFSGTRVDSFTCSCTDEEDSPPAFRLRSHRTPADVASSTSTHNPNIPCRHVGLVLLWAKTMQRHKSSGAEMAMYVCPQRRLTEEQSLQLKNLYDKYSNLTVAELGVVLRRNGQSTNGLKAELVARAVDGEMWGALPRCVQCSRGQLVLVNGKYYCKGSYNDVTKLVESCPFTAEYDDVRRIRWFS